MSSSVVIYGVGPQWRRDRPLMAQECALGHLTFIETIMRAGLAVTAGPFVPSYRLLDGDQVGIIVLTVDADEAARVVARDPAVVAGLLIARVHPFYPVTGPG